MIIFFYSEFVSIYVIIDFVICVFRVFGIGSFAKLVFVIAVCCCCCRFVKKNVAKQSDYNGGKIMRFYKGNFLHQ
jgi:hypothetical protein